MMELLIVVVVIFILLGLLLPSVTKDKQRPEQINCVNNLKQVGLSFRMWAGDNGDIYPMHFRTNGFNGEALAYPWAMYNYFQIISNELNTPKILICPADVKRQPASNFFSNFNSSAISYFVGLDARADTPQALLAGDRNLTNETSYRQNVVEFTTNSITGWTDDLHQRSGNVLLGDGSIQKVTISGVRKLISSTGLQTNRLVFPMK